MKEYFIGIIAVVSIGSLLVSLAPGGSYSKQLRLLCGLCSAGCIIFPLLTFAADIDGRKNEFIGLFEENDAKNEYYDEIYNNTIIGVEEKNAEERLKNEIIQELDLESETFDIKIIGNQENEEKYIKMIEIIIYSNGIGIDPHAVSGYVEKRIGCETEVIYDFK